MGCDFVVGDGVYEPPASRFAGTPFNSPSERGRERISLMRKGEGVFLEPVIAVILDDGV